MKYTPKTNSKWIDLALNQSFLLERFWLSNCWPFFCISHVWWFPNIALPPVLIHLMFGFSMNFLPSSELGVPPWLWKPPYVYGCFSWILSREITVPCWAWAPSRSGHLVNHLWRGSPWSLGLKRWDSTRKNGDFFWWVHWEKYGWHWMVIEWWLNGVYQFIWLPSPTINGVLTILCWCYSLGWSGDATGDGKIIKSNHRNQHGHGLAGYLLMAMIFMTFK